jgi:hypothetical protein
MKRGIKDGLMALKPGPRKKMVPDGSNSCRWRFISEQKGFNSYLRLLA